MQLPALRFAAGSACHSLTGLKDFFEAALLVLVIWGAHWPSFTLPCGCVLLTRPYKRQSRPCAFKALILFLLQLCLF